MTPQGSLKHLSDDYSKGLLERDVYRRRRAALLAQLTAPPTEAGFDASTPLGGRRLRYGFVVVLLVALVAAGVMLGLYLLER